MLWFVHRPCLEGGCIAGDRTEVVIMKKLNHIVRTRKTSKFQVQIGGSTHFLALRFVESAVCLGEAGSDDEYIAIPELDALCFCARHDLFGGNFARREGIVRLPAKLIEVDQDATADYIARAQVSIRNLDRQPWASQCLYQCLDEPTRLCQSCPKSLRSLRQSSELCELVIRQRLGSQMYVVIPNEPVLVLDTRLRRSQP